MSNKACIIECVAGILHSAAQFTLLGCNGSLNCVWSIVILPTMTAARAQRQQFAVGALQSHVVFASVTETTSARAQRLIRLLIKINHTVSKHVHHIVFNFVCTVSLYESKFVILHGVLKMLSSFVDRFATDGTIKLRAANIRRN